MGGGGGVSLLKRGLSRAASKSITCLLMRHVFAIAGRVGIGVCLLNLRATLFAACVCKLWAQNEVDKFVRLIKSVVNVLLSDI